jgi:hypothetical protein
VTLVAIHQPNFLPWLGYFDKLARADVFVVLDDVQFPKRGGTWVNRVRMLVSGQPAWVTVPVDRSYRGTRTIHEMAIDGSSRWREKLTRTVAQSYRRAPYFEETMPLVERVIGMPTERLAEFNETGIRLVCEALGIDTGKLRRSSELGVTSTATERLIELTRAVGGDAYLAGGGAGGYQDDELFPRSGVELVEQRFEHPDYPQLSDEPVEGLSVVDALMSCGREGTPRLLGLS